MASAGFSVPSNIFGTITGLTPKSSSDGKTSSLAECPDSNGDTTVSDVYGEVLAPSVEFAVTGSFTSSTAMVNLGTIHTITEGSGSTATTHKIMLNKCDVKTAAGTPPTVTLSGVEVEAGATQTRSYPVAVSLTPRAKAQDVCGAFTASSKFTAIDASFSCDAAISTVAGTPVASDAYHGKIEISATQTDGDGTGTITLDSSGGFTLSSAPSETRPDAGYIQRTATAVKFTTGTTVTST